MDILLNYEEYDSSSLDYQDKIAARCFMTAS